MVFAGMPIVSAGVASTGTSRDFSQPGGEGDAASVRDRPDIAVARGRVGGCVNSSMGASEPKPVAGSVSAGEWIS